MITISLKRTFAGFRLHALDIRCHGSRLLRRSVPGSRTFSGTKSQLDRRTTGSTHDDDPSTKVWTIPNVLTFSRIAAAPLLTYFIAYDMKTAALCGCLAAGFSDWLDGYIAKNYNMSSLLGEVVDPIADKVVIGCLAAGLTIKGIFPFSLMGLIIFRDVALLGGATYLRYREKPPGAPLFDPSSFTFHVKPSLLSKANTVLQFFCMASTLYVFVLDEGSAMRALLVEDYMPPLWMATGATTVLSGLGYLDGSGVAAIQRRVDVVQAKVQARASHVQAEVTAVVQANAELIQNRASHVQTKVRLARAKAMDIAGIALPGDREGGVRPPVPTTFPSETDLSKLK